MSRAKELKIDSTNNLNLYELFSLFTFQNKSKYTELLLKIIKNTPSLSTYANEVRTRLKSEFDIKDSDLNNLSDFQLVLFYKILETTFNLKDLNSFKKFCEYNERKLIKQNDLTKYNNFDDVLNALHLAELKVESKNLEKQIKIVYENDDWILLRPLTFAASKKYGSNTKWCTTQQNNPDYYFKYVNKGVLIYCINKVTGYKVASFYSLDKSDPEFSFWNQKDNRIDSLETELTDELRKKILLESTNSSAKTNRFLLSDEERIKEESTLKREFGNSNMMGIALPEPQEHIEVDMDTSTGPQFSVSGFTDMGHLEYLRSSSTDVSFNNNTTNTLM
jgi:hypothetical protein